MWAMQWFTPMMGILNIMLKDLATIQPTVKGPPIPGPFVYDINPIWDILRFAIYKASYISSRMFC